MIRQRGTSRRANRRQNHFSRNRSGRKKTGGGGLDGVLRGEKVGWRVIEMNTHELAVAAGEVTLTGGAAGMNLQKHWPISDQITSGPGDLRAGDASTVVRQVLSFFTIRVVWNLGQMRHVPKRGRRPAGRPAKPPQTTAQTRHTGKPATTANLGEQQRRLSCSRCPVFFPYRRRMKRWAENGPSAISIFARTKAADGGEMCQDFAGYQESGIRGCDAPPGHPKEPSHGRHEVPLRRRLWVGAFLASKLLL